MANDSNPISKHSNKNSAWFRVLIIGISILFATSNVLAGPADLDTSFGTLGKVQSSPTGQPDTAGNGMALQADGKIVMVGSNPNSGFFIVARFNSNGTLDNDFGTGGWTSITFPGIQGQASAVAIQPDGKIVVVGTVYSQLSPSLVADGAVARLNSDGSPDMGFDSDGKTLVDFNAFIGASYYEFHRLVKIAPDGKIVIGGSALLSGNHNRFLFTRLNTDGSPDMTFGTAGQFADTPNGGSTRDLIHDFVVLPDGSIVAAGQIIAVNGNLRIAIKYTPAGTARVWTYSEGTIGAPGEWHSFNGIAALPDGKFVLTGRADTRIKAARLNSNGTIDPSFASPANLPVGYAYSIGVQADGKIVANVETATNSSFSLFRWNANGTVDSTFAGGGIASTSVISVAADTGLDVIVQPDGKILVGGLVKPTSTTYNFAMVRYRGGELVTNRAPFDYDGDNKSDVSVYRPSDMTWYLNRSTAGFIAHQFGNPTDGLVPADYDGDGKTDIGVYHDGEWWLIQSSDSVVKVITFGAPSDKPQPGDYDGDGFDDIAVWRPSNGVWYVLRSTDWGYHSVAFGATGDIPQRGDYDDDGKIDFALFRPSNGTWYVQPSSGGYLSIPFGTNGDQPVSGDYDGDSSTDIAVWRPSNGVWYVLRSSNDQTTSTAFGVSTDVPVPGDYDGDGKIDVAVFRPSNGVWYQILSTSGQWASQVFGFGTDRPTPSAFAP